MLDSTKTRGAPPAALKRARARAAELLTDELKKDRAVAGGYAAAANMSATERSARARKAANAKHAKKTTNV